MTADPVSVEYLASVGAALTRVFEDSLLAVYATGSLALGDFDRGRSDIDLLAVTQLPLSADQRQRVREELDHQRLPCPAKGLDFAVVSSAVAASPPRIPRLEFAISTGHTWRLEVDDEQEDGEMVLHLGICRQAGVPLLGPASTAVIGQVPRRWLLEQLDAVLRWHAERIFDPYHDPLAQFSTLNACRAWYFAETGLFCSKTAGGEWVLARNPENSLVAAAMDNRSGKARRQPERHAVEQFLQDVRGRLHTAVG